MSSAESDTRSWYLRIISGVVYGPVPTQSLRSWAEQGRVQPGDEISLDQKTWQPVQDLEELDISWYLEDSTGALTGPFNKSAAERLISEGRVGDGTSLVYKDDADLSKLVRTSGRRPRNTADDSQTEFDFSAGEAGGIASETDLRAEIADLKLRIEELDNIRRQLIQSAEKDNKVHNRQLEAERKKVAALQIEVDDLKALEDNVRSVAVADAEAKVAESRAQAVADAEKPLKERISELEKLLAEAPAKAEAPLNARIVELEKLLEDAPAKAEAPLKEHIAELEKKLADAPEAAAEPLLKRIASLETELRTAAEATEALEAKAAAEAAEPLNEQIASLKAKLDEVTAYRVDTDNAVRDATAPLLVRIDELEADKVNAVQQAASDAAIPLNARIAELEERVARKTAEDMAALSAASDESSRLKAKIVELEAERDKYSDELGSAKASLEQLQSDYSELLSFSNSRDAENLAESQKSAEEIASLRKQLDASKVKLQQVISSTAPDASGQYAVNAATIKAERDFLSHLIEDSLRHQKLISDHIAHLDDAKSESVAESIDRHERQRISIKLRNAEIDAERLSAENKRITEKADAREKEMQTRIRLLEVELDRVKVSALDTDNIRQRNSQLIEQLRETEQSLSLEKQAHQADIDQFGQAQQVLVEKVQKLEAERSSLPIKHEEDTPAPASSDGYISASLNPTGKKFHATPWMTFKR